MQFYTVHYHKNVIKRIYIYQSHFSASERLPGSLGTRVKCPLPLNRRVGLIRVMAIMFS
jgi:hypothetical protein